MNLINWETDCMSVVLNCNEWAKDVFGECQLGDRRLTARLQKIGTQLSGSIGSSLAFSCNGSDAALEGSYRILRNNKVTSQKIAEAGYKSTAKKCVDRDVLLAVEDTTTMGFSHKVKDQLGDLGGRESINHKGFIIHSSLMIDGKTEETIGLIDQKRWCRDNDARNKSSDRRKRSYHSKESYKWEENSRRIEERFGSLMSRVISVCDREADIYEYMQYKISNSQRFIVRASWNRRLQGDDENLSFDKISNAKLLGEYKVKIGQKSGRKSRVAVVELKSNQITLHVPVNTNSLGLTPLTVNIVFVVEKNCPTGIEPLKWILLTTEDVIDFDKARLVTRYYELRWRIEDFHKAWKTGAGAERQRMQEADNLEKMIVILSFIAVRLLQLKEYFEKEPSLDAEKQVIPCTTVLSQDEWQILWFSTESKKRLPIQAASLGWAYRAISKLGGWNDTKKIGKASWATVWKGWFKLQERIEGYTILKNLGKRYDQETAFLK